MKYDAHNSKVTQVHLREGVSIVSSSLDGTMFFKSLNLDIEKASKSTRRIELKKHQGIYKFYEITCFCLVNS